MGAYTLVQVQTLAGKRGFLFQQREIPDTNRVQVISLPERKITANKTTKSLFVAQIYMVPR